MKQRTKNKCPGGSVGVIFYMPVSATNGKILLLERKTHPLGWAPPAGHLDGEKPEKQADAEAKEEIGLTITKKELILGPIELMNECSRPKGEEQKYNCHDWWVYKVLDWKGTPMSGEPDKIGEVVWFNKDEIMSLNLDPAWKELFPMIWQYI